MKGPEHEVDSHDRKGQYRSIVQNRVQGQGKVGGST